MNYNVAKKIRVILLVIACITVIVGFFLSKTYEDKAAHNPENIKIEMISCESKYDDANYYVYMGYKIDNSTKATIDYIAITTYISDKDGKSIGTITSDFGSIYSDSALNLDPEKEVIKETYLSERQAAYSHSDMFIELYNNGIEDLVITYEITSVKWSDGYYYNR